MSVQGTAWESNARFCRPYDFKLLPPNGLVPSRVLILFETFRAVDIDLISISSLRPFPLTQDTTAWVNGVQFAPALWDANLTAEGYDGDDFMIHGYGAREDGFILLLGGFLDWQLPVLQRAYTLVLPPGGPIVGLDGAVNLGGTVGGV